jgi:hypothetical protein
MTASRLFMFSLALVLFGAALAQERPATDPAPAAPSSGDCAKPLARHDHGAEKGTPSPKAGAPCADAPAASAAKTKAKAKAKGKPGHDHSKVHKLM